MSAVSGHVFRVGSGHTKRLLVYLLAIVAVVLVLGAVSPASDGGVLAKISPQPAEAFQGGWDRNHWWIKVTRGEVGSGIVTAVCAYYVRIPSSSYVCTPLSQTAKRIIGGASGFWAEIYPPRWVWYSNGLGWWTQPYTRVGTW